jgi:hypothetical protein
MEKKLSVLGIDIAKQVFHLVGLDTHGTMVVRKRLYRAQVMVFIAQLPPTCIGMEACGGKLGQDMRYASAEINGSCFEPKICPGDEVKRSKVARLNAARFGTSPRSKIQ